MIRNLLAIFFFCSFFASADNIISVNNNGKLEKFGNQYNSSYRSASNIHDGNTTNQWFSTSNNSNNYFIFSFADEEARTYNFLKLYNYGSNDSSVRNFLLFSSDDPIAKNDPSHFSWEKIGIYKNGSSTLFNVLNKHSGAELKLYGNQYNSSYRSAENSYDGHVTNEWFSTSNNTNNYFIYAFENENSYNINSFHLYNYGNNTVSIDQFYIKTSSDPVALSDPDHSSWLPVSGTVSSDKVNILHDSIASLVKFGNQYNSSYRSAENSHDGHVTNEWFSTSNNSNNYFIYEFLEERIFNVDTLKLFNYGDNAVSIKDFVFYYSNDDLAANDPSHDSWQTFTGSSLEQANVLLSKTGTVLTQFGNQYNSSYRKASNLHDGHVTNEWFSTSNNTDNYFIFSFPQENIENFSSLELYNYGSASSVKNFKLFYSDNDAALTDSFHPSWLYIKGNNNTKANLVNKYIGANLEKYGNQYNSSYRKALNIMDGGLTNEWFSTSNNTDNYFIISLPEKKEQKINTVKLFNYGVNDVSVQDFQIFCSNNDDALSDANHASWQSVTGHTNNGLINLINRYIGAQLKDYGSQYNSSYRSAINICDGLFTNEWFSVSNNFDNYFIISLPDEVQRMVNQIDFYNYGNNNASVKDFKLMYSNDAAALNDPDHASWNNINGVNNAELANLLNMHNGSTLHSYGSQYNSSYRKALNIIDGGLTNEWMSASNNFENYFIVSFKDQAVKDINTVKLYNWGSSISVKDLCLFTSNDDAAANDSGHASWQKITGTNDNTKVNLLNKHFGASLYDFGFQANSSSRKAANVQDGGVTNEWLSSSGHINDNYFIFIMPGSVAKNFNSFKLTNWGGSDVSVNEFTLWYSNADTARDDPTSVDWVSISKQGGGAVFQADNISSNQTFTFDATYSGKYFMMKILNNNGSATYTGLREIELYGDLTLNDSGAFRFIQESGVQSFSFDNQANKKYFMVKVASNYGSNYSGFREIELYGSETKDQTSILTAQKIAGKQTFSFDDINTRYLMMRVMSNYGSNYTGMRELQAYGDATKGALGLFTAQKQSGEQEFVFDDINTKYIQMRVVSNYGSNYTGFREFEVYGDATLGDYGVFSAMQSSAKQTFSFIEKNAKHFQFRVIDNYGSNYTGLREIILKGSKTLGNLGGNTALRAGGEQNFVLNSDPVNNPINAKYLMLKILNNYGSNYTGFREIEAYGDTTLADLGVFKALKNGAKQIFTFNDVNARYLLFDVLNNYGSNYTGFREVEVYGNQTLAMSSIYEAARTGGDQGFFLNETTSKYFMLKVANNYGSNYTGMREVELYSVFLLGLKDPETGSTSITNNSLANNQEIDVMFSNLEMNELDYMISEDSNFNGTSWISIPDKPIFSIKWQLSSGDGLKTVYAKVKDVHGDIESNHQTITLDTTPPLKVTNPSAVSSISKIDLSWENPADPDFYGAEVRYTTVSYPSSAVDGVLLNRYEGNQGQKISIEHNNLQNGITYYYSIFTYDFAGNYSEAEFIQATPVSPPEGFFIEVPNVVAAGQDFNVQVSIYNTDGKLDKTFNDEVEISINYIAPEQGSHSVSFSKIVFVEGIANTVMSYPDAGIITIVAVSTSDNNINGESAQITFIPDQFDLLVSKERWFAEEPFSLTISPLNRQGEVTQNYQGQVTIESELQKPLNGQGELSISTYDLNGTTVIENLTYNNSGTISLRVYDDSYFSGRVITGESIGLTFIPYNFILQNSSYPDKRNFYYIGELFDLLVYPVSFKNNITSNYRGTIVFQEDDSLIIDQEGFSYTFTDEDVNGHTFKDFYYNSKGLKTLKISDMEYSDLSVESSKIEIKYGKIKIFNTQGPVGDLLFKVAVVDDNGDIIKDENSLQFKLAIIESNNNETYKIENNQELFSITKGETLIKISNTEAEALLIDPLPEKIPLNTVRGEIIFIEKNKSSPFSGDGGIRILLWKEIDK